MRYELTEEYEWAAIRPFLPNKPRGVPRLSDRRVLNGIFWVLRSGAPWRDLPETFGLYTTCYNRFVRWGTGPNANMLAYRPQNGMNYEPIGKQPSHQPCFFIDALSRLSGT